MVRHVVGTWVTPTFDRGGPGVAQTFPTTGVSTLVSSTIVAATTVSASCHKVHEDVCAMQRDGVAGLNTPFLGIDRGRRRPCDEAVDNLDFAHCRPCVFMTRVGPNQDQTYGVKHRAGMGQGISNQTNF
jgi:hypothetical protein